MILEPGTFNVDDYRRNISPAVKLACFIQQGGKSTDGVPFTVEDALTGNIQFDHDPALTNRSLDTEAHDFIPPQLDPAHIFAKRKRQHLAKTTGRKEDAEKTVTTRGSDVGERTRTRDIRARQAGHQAVMAVKAGLGPQPAVQPAVSGNAYWDKKREVRASFPARKMQSRGFDKTQTRGFGGKVRPRKQRRRS